MMRRASVKFVGGILSVVIWLFFVGFFGEARAVTERQVVINEIMWDGAEYVELFNTGEEDILLDGWIMTRQQEGKEIKVVVEFDEEDIIKAGDYYLLEKNEEATTVVDSKVVSSLTLVNTGELVELKNDLGEVVDRANWLGEWLAGGNTSEGIAMERSVWNSDGKKKDSWHTSTGELGGRQGTPGAVNSVPVVNSPPEAVVSGRDNRLAGEEMLFSGEDSSDENGDELEYSWLFGDGDSAVGVDVAHVYEQAGVYSVMLSVSDGELEDEAEVLVVITAPIYSDDIVINEFLPNPIGSDTTGEFIEIKNIGEEVVNVGTWRLDDGEGGSKPFIIPDGVELEAGAVKSFSRVETKVALNNGGDMVRLLDPLGEVKSSFSYSESVAEGVSYNREGEGQYTLSAISTPGEDNIVTSAVEEEEGDDPDYSNDIVINEFLPNPVGSDTVNEFIELKNIGTEEVNLAGWKIDDGEGGSSAFTVSASISLGGGKIVVFMRSETKVALNNGGDTVRLLDPLGEIKSSFSYSESVAEGMSYNREGEGQYTLSATSTPGEENIITELLEDEEDSVGVVGGTSVVQVALKDVRSQELGVMVEVEGIISVPPGVFGEKVMYLAGSGIQIYFYKEDYPELALGEKVKVRGELVTSLGEYRIKLSDKADIVVMGEAEAPLPHKVKTGEVGEVLEGTLVMFVGRVASTSGDTFYVDDGSGEVKVFIKKTTQIDKPKMKKGAVVTITGVVSRTNKGYRVLPRWQNDVRLGRVAGMTDFPIAGSNFVWIVVVAVIWLSVIRQASEAREPLLKIFWRF